MKDVPTTAESMGGSSVQIHRRGRVDAQSKKFGDQKRFLETRCALAIATYLQHPERLAESRSALISSASPLGSHHHDHCGQNRAHDHESADDLPSLFFMTRHCCRPPRASHQPQQGRDAENGKRGKPAHHGEHLFVPTRHRAPPTLEPGH